MWRQHEGEQDVGAAHLRRIRFEIEPRSRLKNKASTQGRRIKRLAYSDKFPAAIAEKTAFDGGPQYGYPESKQVASRQRRAGVEQQPSRRARFARLRTEEGFADGRFENESLIGEIRIGVAPYSMSDQVVAKQAGIDDRKVVETIACLCVGEVFGSAVEQRFVVLHQVIYS